MMTEMTEPRNGMGGPAAAGHTTPLPDTGTSAPPTPPGAGPQYGVPASAAAPTSGTEQSGASHPTPGPQPYWGTGFPPPPPTGPESGSGGGSGGKRPPGWGGVLAVGVTAALVASLLTAGIVTALGSDSSGTGAVPGLAATAAPPPVPVKGNGSAPDWTTVAAAVEPSVVSVTVTTGNGGDEGSGVVIDKQGHVVTNNHVIAAAANGGSIAVTLSDGRIYPATVVGTDPSTDLAVMQIKNAPANLTPATFGNSSTVKVGDPVLAVGNPLGLSDTATTGIVSALNRPVTTSSTPQQPQNPFGFGQQPQTEQVVTNAIQTDAAVNPGNSGGALVDGQGEVIGITSSIATLGNNVAGGQSGSIGLGFAIPANEVRNIAQQLISTGKAQHAYLGVTVGNGTVAVDGTQRQAAVLGSVGAGTPAAKAGLQAKDAIIALNGQPVAGADYLVAQIRALSPGTKVTVTVVRGGHTQDLTVTLGQRPAGSTG